MSTGDWSLVQPAAVTNLVTNPVAATGTTGWTATSGALSRVVGAGAQGAYGFRLLASAVNGRAETASLFTTSGSEQVTASAWVRSASASVFLQLYNQTDGVVLAETAHSGNGLRTRLGASATVVTLKAVRVRVIDKRSSAWTNVDFGGVQLERGRLVATTYIDGDQPGCRWAGTAHLSTSERSGQSRAGGTIVSLGDYLDNITQMGGVGMPPLDVIRTEYGQLDGSRHQRTRAKERSFMLTGMLVGSTLADLHASRDGLAALLAPDTVTSQQPVMLRYEGRSGVLRIRAHYEGGLEMPDHGNRPERIETVVLRFVALDPYWESEMESAASLTALANVTNANAIVQRSVEGQWGAMGTGMAGGVVYDLKYGADGALYAGGAFTGAGGVGSTAKIARWDGLVWSSITPSGAANGDVHALEAMPNGDIYATGDFTSINGVAANRIAKYVPSTGVWTALGTGLASGNGEAIAVAPNGTDIYVGGLFTGAGGVANTANIAKWNGSVWSSVTPSGACNSTVRTIATTGLANAPVVYAGGSFTSINGVTTYQIARLEGTTWSKLGASGEHGVDDIVRALAIKPNGNVVVGGDFDFMDWDGAAGKSANRIAEFVPGRTTGTATAGTWKRYGAGVSGGLVFTVAVDETNGNVIATGTFTQAGNKTLPDSVARWNGSNWQPLDINLPGTATVYAVVFGRGTTGRTLTLGYSTTGTATAATSNVAVANNGSAPAKPRLVLSGGSGAETPVNFANWTTGLEIIWDSDFRLNSGAVYTLDLEPGDISFRSNKPEPNGKSQIQVIAPTSDLATWALQPGLNSVTSFIDVGSSIAAHLVWRDRFLSADGAPV